MRIFSYLSILILFLLSFFSQIASAQILPPVPQDFVLSQNKSIRPAYLQKGDSVAVVSISSEVEDSESEAKELISQIEKWGFKVKLGKHLFDTDDGWFSGSDSQRAKDLQNAIDNENVKAIIFYRGGYGAIRVVDKIDFTALRKFPKWLVGYSDITVLHSALKREGIESIHGQMPSKFTLKDDDISASNLYNALVGKLRGYVFPSNPLNQKGEASGVIVGGNLRVLSYINGSKWDLDTEDAILFIEEIAEPMSIVDQMLRELKNSGKFSNIKGIIFGHMTYIKLQERWGESVHGLLKEYTHELGIPVVFDFPAGHETPNQPLYMGRKVRLSVSKELTELQFLN